MGQLFTWCSPWPTKDFRVGVISHTLDFGGSSSFSSEEYIFILLVMSNQLVLAPSTSLKLITHSSTEDEHYISSAITDFFLICGDPLQQRIFIFHNYGILPQLRNSSTTTEFFHNCGFSSFSSAYLKSDWSSGQGSAIRIPLRSVVFRVWWTILDQVPAFHQQVMCLCFQVKRLDSTWQFYSRNHVLSDLNCEAWIHRTMLPAEGVQFGISARAGGGVPGNNWGTTQHALPRNPFSLLWWERRRRRLRTLVSRSTWGHRVQGGPWAGSWSEW